MELCSTLTTKEAEVRASVEVLCRLEEQVSEATWGIEQLRAFGTEFRDARDRNSALLADRDTLSMNIGQATADWPIETSAVQALQAEVFD